jgi:hypothetical protein
VRSRQELRVAGQGFAGFAFEASEGVAEMQVPCGLLECGGQAALFDVIDAFAGALGEGRRTLLGPINEVRPHRQSVVLFVDSLVLQPFGLCPCLSLKDVSALPEVLADAVDQ